MLGIFLIAKEQGGFYTSSAGLSCILLNNVWLGSGIKNLSHSFKTGPIIYYGKLRTVFNLGLI